MNVEQLEKNIMQNSNVAYELAGQAMEIKVVSEALTGMLLDLDEAIDKGANAQLTLEKLHKAIRLIDLAFCPLAAKVEETSNQLEKVSDTLVDLIRK